MFALHQAYDACSGAAFALLVFLAVRVKRPVKVPGGAVYIDVEGVEACPAGGKGVQHHLTGGVENPQRIGAAERFGGPGVMEARPPQRLVRVDVADPGNESLVQQRTFESSLTAPQPAVKGIEGKIGIQGIPGDVGRLFGNKRLRDLPKAAGSAVGRWHQRRDKQTTKDALVHESELFRHAVGGAQPQAHF
ncbi:hypothetical protein D9M72_349430 [compost metagenome]